MDWSTYKKNFCLVAVNSNHNEEYISRCLEYAYNLHSNNYPIIYTQDHLAQLVGFSTEYLHKVSNSQKHFYKKYNILKKSGGVRTISEPLPNLKEIQRWILEEILYKHTVSKFAKAYVKGNSIKDNARFHRKQSTVLSIDLNDFFGTIKWHSVYNVFKSIGYSRAVSVILTNLCTLKKCLPQGAPTSPALSNIICIPIDNRISKYTLKHKIRYTRYADDMTFSGDFDIGSVINMMEKIIADYGFKLNTSKTKVMKANERQVVTGISVNNKIRVSNDVTRKLRQECYYIKKYGLESHIDRLGIKQANYVQHLLGVANHVRFVRPDDADALDAIKLLKNYLPGK